MMRVQRCRVEERSKQKIIDSRYDATEVIPVEVSLVPEEVNPRALKHISMAVIAQDDVGLYLEEILRDCRRGYPRMSGLEGAGFELDCIPPEWRKAFVKLHSVKRRADRTGRRCCNIQHRLTPRAPC